jgi:prepilin-type N-terminal cleavage/methylation domain-containing protein
MWTNPMKILKNNAGYTLIEVLLALTVMGLICAGAAAVMTSSVCSFNTLSFQTTTDSAAVAAMQTIVADVREAKDVSPGGNSLVVTFPVRTTDGYFDRHTADLTKQNSYYISDATGDPGKAGTSLWQNRGGSRRVLARKVSSLVFAQDSPCSIEITIIMMPTTEWNHRAKGAQQTKLTQRVVYLRNY